MARARTRSAEKGLTFIEISLVLVILGLTVSGVLVALDRFMPEYRRAAMGRELSAVVKQARTMSWTTAQKHWLVYDLDGHRHRIILPFKRNERPLRLADTEEQRFALPWVAMEGMFDLEIWFPNGEHVNQGLVTIEFDPRGTFPTHYLVVIDRKTEDGIPKAFTLEARGTTGEAVFYEGEPKIQKEIREADFE